MAADPLTRFTVDGVLNEQDDVDWDDLFADKATTLDRDDKAILSPRKRKADDDKENFGLGLDEEVNITKKRKPIAKLDVERLLSQPGIPKLRQVTQSGRFSKKLRLRGKGHEFSDTARLLSHYQLWLDNLYPRAKFADALQLVEKAGHQKRMQVMRKAWIDESKPGYSRDKALREEIAQQEKAAGAQEADAAANGAQNQGAPVEIDQDEDAMFFDDGDAVPNDEANDGPDDDELEALLAQQDDVAPRRTNQQSLQAPESEGEDDLDALLAEHGHHKKVQPPTEDEDEDDELDALINEHESSQIAGTSLAAVQPSNEANEVEHAEEEDELDALLAQRDDMSEPDLPPLSDLMVKSSPKRTPKSTTEKAIASEEVPELVNTISSSPIPNIETDDLDRLMDEHDAANRKEDVAEMDEHFLSSSPIPNTQSQEV